MMRSMFAGVSGLKNHQIRMDVLGNNIANVNTTGFKASRVTFQDMLSQTIRSGTAPTLGGAGGINPAQVGLGMIIGSIDTLHTQGNLGSTGKSTDMAIQGNGFFVMSDGGTTRYSRDGAFDLGQDGDLVNPSNGFRVQGWSAVNGDVDTTAAVGDVNIPIGSKMVANATRNIYLNGNLNASGSTSTTGTVARSLAVLDSAAAAADSSDLLTALRNSDNDVLLAAGDVITISAKKGGAATEEGTLTVGAGTTVQNLLDKMEEVMGVYDDGTAGISIDASGRIVITGNKGSSNAITEVSVLAQSSAGAAKADFNTQMDPDTENGFTQVTAADGESVASSMVGYDSLGVAHTINVVFTKTDENLWTWNADCNDQTSGGIAVGHGTLSFSAAGAFQGSTGSVSMVLDNGATSPLTLSLDSSSVTQFSKASSVSVREQDGYAAGTLERFSIGSDGLITGIYTNGMTEILAQIAISNFANSGGLTKEGNNLYAQSTNSGVAQVGVAGTGGRGTINNSVLEMSNVDLAQTFTDMITTQRGFQANAKIITTSDDMLQELVNLKR